MKVKSIFGSICVVSALAVTGISQAAVITAGDLVVDLRSADLNSASPTWTNEATSANSVGNFKTNGSGNANVVTLAGVSSLYISATGGNAMTSVLASPAVISGSSTSTVEMWVSTSNPYSVFDSTNNVLGYGGGTNNNGSTRVYGYTNNGNGHSAFSGYFDDLKYADGTPPIDSSFHLVDWTYDGTTMNVYVDGVLNTSGNLALSSPSTLIHLGAGETNNNPFSGYIAAARIETGVLSASNIAANYQAGVLATVPEPASLAIVGLVGASLASRRRRLISC